MIERAIEHAVEQAREQASRALVEKSSSGLGSPPGPKLGGPPSTHSTRPPPTPPAQPAPAKQAGRAHVHLSHACAQSKAKRRGSGERLCLSGTTGYRSSTALRRPLLSKLSKEALRTDEGVIGDGSRAHVRPQERQRDLRRAGSAASPLQASHALEARKNRHNPCESLPTEENAATAGDCAPPAQPRAPSAAPSPAAAPGWAAGRPAQQRARPRSSAAAPGGGQCRRGRSGGRAGWGRSGRG